MMVRFNFSEVKLHGSKSGKCGCGKRRTRQKKFYQTLNPFNKNEKGEPKTQKEIYAELVEQHNAWKTEPITCKDCEDDDDLRSA